MVYRRLDGAPASALPEGRRGPVLGRFCRACGSIYPLHRAIHRGKPSLGKDHVATPCSHEGEEFAAGESWWEPAVEPLPAPAEEA